MAISATVKAKRKTKSRSKPKSKAERKEINQRNSMLSTGPRTSRGKGKSKYNAVTHGLTARSVLLPGEDPSQLAARQQQLIDDLQPRHSAELTAIERMAGAIWRSDRSERAAGNRLVFRLRHEPLEQAKKEQDEAIELGGRLLWQPAFPLPISRRFPIGKLTEPQCAENAFHPHHPARLRLQLEQTIPGIEWLLDRFGDLMRRICRDDLWLSADAFKMVRLLGKHAIEMADDLDVTRVFLSSLTLLSAPKAGPERDSFDWNNALITMLVTFDVENKKGIAASAANQCEPFARRLAELPLARLAPKDEEEARESLITVIDQEKRRLQEMLLVLRSIANADLAEAPARLAFETGPEGDRYRRYELSNERLALQSYDRFLRTRNFVVTGRFDLIDVDLQSLIGSAAPQAEARAGEARSAATPHHPACGRPLAERRDEEEGDRVVSPNCATGTGDRPGLDVPDLSHYEKIGCDDEHFLRNEAIAHRGDPRNEASADGGEQETDATTASRFDETEFGHSRVSPGDVERSAPVRSMADGSLEANLDLERRRREFKKRSPFRAMRPEKRSERARREAEEAKAALRARSGQEISASSAYDEISCDDEHFLRNEANAHCGDLRNEASAHGGEQDTDATTATRCDEAEFGHSLRSPGNVERSARAKDGTDGTFEANIDIDRLRMELGMQTPFQALGPGKPSERARREEEEAEAALHALSFLEMPASSPHQEISCDDGNVLRNEANAAVVSGPLSVVGCPLQDDVCNFEEAVDEPNTTNEPTAVRELAMNEPTAVQVLTMNPLSEDRENAANEPTEGGSDPAGSPNTGTDAPPEPMSNGGDTSGAEREPDPDFQETLERLTANKKVADEFHRREMIRVENVRKLDEEWWKDAEAAEAACRSHGRGHAYGNPGDREATAPNPQLEARDDDNRNELARRRASIEQLKALQFKRWSEEKIRRARAEGVTDFPFPASGARSSPVTS